MSERSLRSVLSWLLILHVLHLPIPCPDIDGECRGVEIHSLAESHAWHVILLGIRPAADVDRGPFCPVEEERGQSRPSTPFGDEAVQAKLNGVDLHSVDLCRTVIEPAVRAPLQMGDAERLMQLDALVAVDGGTSVKRCALLCSWAI